MKAINLKHLHPKQTSRAFALVWHSSPHWTLVNLLLIFIQGLLPIVLLYLFKLIIDTIEEQEASIERIIFLIGLSALIALLNNTFQSVSTYINEAQIQDVTDYMQKRLHEKAISVDLAFFENSSYQDTLHRAKNEGASRPTQIVTSLVDFSRNGLSLAALLGLLLTFHWGLVVILVVAVLPSLTIRLIYADKLYESNRKRSLTERQARHLHGMLIGDHNAREIRLFGIGPFFMVRFRQLRQHLRREKLQLTAWQAKSSFVVQACQTISVFGAFAFMAYQSVRGAVTLGDLVVFYQAFQQAQGFLQGVVQSVSTFYENNLLLSNFYEFLDLKPAIAEPAQPQPVPRTWQRGLVLENVTFSYPNSPHVVLNHIDLTIRPGETIALVGENGSGKTTLAKLLCRFYDPCEGRITLEGIDIRHFKPAELRQQISVIFQDYIWYHLLTAQENIWLGKIDAPPDEQQLIAAAQRSGADAFVRRLPQGYDTIMGRLFEFGEALSVGQWQRLAIARAFYREAPLIILDEPSSALDPKAESEVFDKFRQLTRQQTAILISHRLSNVKAADCIYVLQHGNIVEMGNHDQLIALGGHYKSLFEAQAKHYR